MPQPGLDAPAAWTCAPGGMPWCCLGARCAASLSQIACRGTAFVSCKSFAPQRCRQTIKGWSCSCLGHDSVLMNQLNYPATLLLLEHRNRAWQHCRLAQAAGEGEYNLDMLSPDSANTRDCQPHPYLSQLAMHQQCGLAKALTSAKQHLQWDGVLLHKPSTRCPPAVETQVM